MTRGIRVLRTLLVGVLIIGLTVTSGFRVTTVTSQAATLSDAQKKAQELENQKKAAEVQQSELSGKLTAISDNMAKTQADMDAKQAEIDVVEEELIAAQIKENDQYESMKKRIQFMYENGNAEFLEILCSAKNMTDLLNKAEYVDKISTYDREMLVEFQEIVEEVQSKQDTLNSQYAELESMQKKLDSQKSEVETLLASTNTKIEDLNAEIGENSKVLQDLLAKAAEAARIQAERASSGGGGSAGDSLVSGNGMMAHPVPGYSRISSSFGYRDSPTAGASTNHKGIDFAASTGTPVYAPMDGTVVTAQYSGNAGNLIVINHGNGYVTKYMHLNKMYVSAGTKVSKGQNIAAVGNTGNSTGPHLHFQVEKNGTPVNPLNYL